MTKTRKKASGIYKRQNTLIHKGMAACGMPYGENKEEWMQLMDELLEGRRLKAEGLSDLTLFERNLLIQHFRGKGIRLYSPGVPEQIREWKKGDPDVEYEFNLDEDPQIRMIFALWNELGYKASSLRGLILKRFKKEDIRWLSPRELNELARLVAARAKARGCGHYYRRKAQN